MPNMANITVKAANGTTDVVYNALTPSAGDSVSAMWRPNAASTIAGHRPVVQMRTQFNGPRTARRVHISGKYPVVVGGAIVATIPVEYNMTLPTGIEDSAAAEAVHQFNNLLVNILITDSIKAGFAPT